MNSFFGEIQGLTKNVLGKIPLGFSRSKNVTIYSVHVVFGGSFL